MNIEDNTYYIDKENNTLEDLVNYKEVKKIVIDSLIIDSINIDYLLGLSNLESITFVDCNIMTSKISKLKVKVLELYDTIIDDLYCLNSINELESLCIDNIDSIDFKMLSILRQLKNFSLSNVNVFNQEYLIYMGSIENLRIDGTNIDDLSVLLSISSLKVLVIDEKQAIDNKEFVYKLIDRGVSVVNYMNQNVVSYYG